MDKGEEIERITISLSKNILKILDEFCEKNHGLDRSKGVVAAIKKLEEKGK